jgi:hypothetical protein
MYHRICVEILEGLAGAISELDDDMLETASTLVGLTYCECMIGLTRLGITLYVAVSNSAGWLSRLVVNPHHRGDLLITILFIK